MAASSICLFQPAITSSLVSISSSCISHLPVVSYVDLLPVVEYTILRAGIFLEYCCSSGWESLPVVGRLFWLSLLVGRLFQHLVVSFSCLYRGRAFCWLNIAAAGRGDVVWAIRAEYCCCWRHAGVLRWVYNTNNIKILPVLSFLVVSFGHLFVLLVSSLCIQYSLQITSLCWLPLCMQYYLYHVFVYRPSITTHIAYWFVGRSPYYWNLDSWLQQSRTHKTNYT